MPRESKVMDLILGMVKPKALKLVFAASLLSMQHLVRSKTGRPSVKIMCLGKVAYLPTDLLSWASMLKICLGVSV